MIMSAYEIPNLRFSLPAGDAVKRHRFVKVGTDGVGEAATASTDIVIGASMNEVAVDQVLEVADGIVIVEASAAIAAGATVVPADEGKAATGNSSMVALTTASAAGEFVAVKI